ncbi:ABC transporter ATP-binding protein [Mycoplasma sp. 1654_15]|uniref:ABC transporter ATP-binding protein n=1 Tax=Mycoplasma sp. 1654_15 TaxID=2725994 RepID=UPI002FE0A1C4
MKLIKTITNFLIKAQYKQYNKNSSGYYYSEIENTIEQSVSQFFSNLLSFFKTLSTILVTLGVFFWINYILALVVLAVIIFFLFIALLLSKKLTKLQTTQLQAISNFNNSLSTYLLTLPTLKTLNSDDKFEFIIKEKNKQNWLTRKRFSLFSDLISVFNEYSSQFFSTIISIGIAVWSFYFISNKDNEMIITNISLIILVQLSFSQFFSASKELLDNYPSMISGWKNIKLFKNNNKFQVDNIQESLETLEEKIFSISIEKLNFKLPDRTLFNNLSFNIVAGNKYIIQGSNGSGKSTLARILLGIEKKFEGNIVINNKFDIKHLVATSLNQHINYVYNNANLFDATVLENITLLDSEKETNIDKILKDVNFEELDVDKEINTSTENFSTGQIQKIHLARSLYESKEILIIDEGLSNLDNENFDKILLNLLQNKNLTLILITHHLEKKYINLFNEIINLDT